MMIAFRYNDKRIFSRIVSWWEGGDCAHCEVILEELSPGHYTCGSASFLDGGVRIKNIHMPPEKWRIYEVPGDPILAKEWFIKHDSAKYDVLGLFGFIFRPFKGSSKRWFCSETAATIMNLFEPFRYGLPLLEAVCMHTGKRVQ